jgi:hypothetical protein
MKKLALVLWLILTLAAGSYAQSEQKVYTIGVDACADNKTETVLDAEGKLITVSCKK